MSNCNSTNPLPDFSGSTGGRNCSDLLTEIGRLHMELDERERMLHPLLRLRDWAFAQELISTPAICCRGAELEERIFEHAALEELAKT